MKCVVNDCTWNVWSRATDGKCYKHSEDAKELRIERARRASAFARIREAKQTINDIASAQAALIDEIESVRAGKGDLARLRALTQAIRALCQIMEKSELIARVKRLLKEEEASGHRKSAG